MKTPSLSRTLNSFVLSAALVLVSLNSSAALYDRGNGMIYDSTQNITWLQDANYALTSGYDPDGKMTWQQATDWAANLVYGGYSDWRLSSAGLIGNDNLSYNGSTDKGYNNTRSELGHLFFELGNKPYYDINGQIQSPGHGMKNLTFIDASTGQDVSFLKSGFGNFWEAETYLANPIAAWYFGPGLGYQDVNNKTHLLSAWAVRAGDVAAVPVPAAAWLMGSGLLGLAGLARCKN